MSAAKNPDREAEPAAALPEPGGATGPASATRHSSVSAESDFPVPTRPTIFYVVASTPRSGSSFLCRQLWSTGLMGAPAEYFNYEGHMLRMAARLQPQNLLEYVQRLFALRTSPNGVFGFKAHWDQFHIVRAGRLLTLFPGLRYVHLERTDRVAQAVSLAKAEQTGMWGSRRQAPIATPVYRPRLIRHWMDRIEQDNGRWLAFFRRLGIHPVAVTYESLAADPDAATVEVLRSFGFAPDPAARIDLRQTVRQADSINRDWIERFRRDHAGPG